MADEMKARGLSKLGGFKAASKSEPAEEHGEGHSIEDHGDGSFTSHLGGKSEKHPDHLHLMAHIGHHFTGGDKHAIAHHDGMTVATHGINEDGSHEDTAEHDGAGEAADHMHAFLGGDEDEPSDEQEGDDDENTSYGGFFA